MDINEEAAALTNDVKQWASTTKSALNGSVRRANIRRYSGILQRSIRARTHIQGQFPQRVSFSFERYGVFVEKGVGRGNDIGNLSRNRRAKPWFNPVMETKLPLLADKVTEHFADLTVKNIFID
jgi:hypothetical protein